MSERDVGAIGMIKELGKVCDHRPGVDFTGKRSLQTSV